MIKKNRREVSKLLEEGKEEKARIKVNWETVCCLASVAFLGRLHHKSNIVSFLRWSTSSIKSAPLSQTKSSNSIPNYSMSGFA